jgi:hypothetical protein
MPARWGAILYAEDCFAVYAHHVVFVYGRVAKVGKE